MPAPLTLTRSLWLRLAAAAIVPLAFFLVLEGGLRLAGFGYDTRFFVPDEAPGTYRTNPRFTERFFPASFGLKPVNFRLARAKPAGTVRIFVLGESAAMGVPEPAFGLAPHLRAYLRALRPDISIEVHNLGVTAIDSHVVLAIAREALAFSPDLLVVYTGNNEVVGPYGASSVVTTGAPPRALIRASLWLRSTRLGQALQRAAAWVVSSGGFREWGGMEMFAGRVVADDDPSLARVREHFSANLADLLACAADAGVPVVLSTVVVNVRDHAPFASLPTAVPPALAEASRLMALEAFSEARVPLERLLAEHPGHAEGHYLLAGLLARAGEEATARQHRLEAWRRDVLRFRADEETNSRIRRSATSAPGRVTLVDAAMALGAAASSPELAGFETFFEHVHFTQAGNRRLARLLAEGAVQALGWPAPAQHAWPADEAVAAALGFTAWGERSQLLAMEELTGRPPFAAQVTFAADRSRLAAEIARLSRRLEERAEIDAARATLARAVAADSGNPWLRLQSIQLALHTGDPSSAARELADLRRLVPASPEVAALEAFVALRSGRHPEALAVLRTAADAWPYHYQTYTLLAAVWAQAGAHEARAWFEERVRRWPASRVLRAAYGQVLRRAGDLEAAGQAWREVLADSPDDERALAPLVELLAEQDRLDEARVLMERAYAANPRSYPNNARLAQLAEHRGDADAQARYLDALADSGPVDARVHAERARLHREAGRTEAARIALLAGRRQARAEGNEVLLRQFHAALGEAD